MINESEKLIGKKVVSTHEIDVQEGEGIQLELDDGMFITIEAGSGSSCGILEIWEDRKRVNPRRRVCENCAHLGKFYMGGNPRGVYICLAMYEHHKAFFKSNYKGIFPEHLAVEVDEDCVCAHYKSLRRFYQMPEEVRREVSTLIVDSYTPRKPLAKDLTECFVWIHGKTIGRFDFKSYSGKLYERALFRRNQIVD